VGKGRGTACVEGCSDQAGHSRHNSAANPVQDETQARDDTYHCKNYINRHPRAIIAVIAGNPINRLAIAVTARNSPVHGSNSTESDDHRGR
jgi:predicted oxidoreductase